MTTNPSTAASPLGRVLIATTSRGVFAARELDGRVRAWNKGATEMFGFTADELIRGGVDAIITNRPAFVRDHAGGRP